MKHWFLLFLLCTVRADDEAPPSRKLGRTPDFSKISIYHHLLTKSAVKAVKSYPENKKKSSQQEEECDCGDDQSTINWQGKIHQVYAHDAMQVFCEIFFKEQIEFFNTIITGKKRLKSEIMDRIVHWGNFELTGITHSVVYATNTFPVQVHAKVSGSRLSRSAALYWQEFNRFAILMGLKYQPDYEAEMRHQAEDLTPPPDTESEIPLPYQLPPLQRHGQNNYFLVYMARLLSASQRPPDSEHTPNNPELPPEARGIFTKAAKEAYEKEKLEREMENEEREDFKRLPPGRDALIAAFAPKGRLCKFVMDEYCVHCSKYQDCLKRGDTKFCRDEAKESISFLDNNNGWNLKKEPECDRYCAKFKRNNECAQVCPWCTDSDWSSNEVKAFFEDVLRNDLRKPEVWRNFKEPVILERWQRLTGKQFYDWQDVA